VLCTGQTVAPNDHSFLIHTPQLNFAEFVYGTNAQDGSSTPNTVGNAIAVDPTRATIIGGSTNVSNSPANKGCVAIPSVCSFNTTNALAGTEAGGTDGWVSVIFFNDILTNAASQSTANPWLEPPVAQTGLVIQGANGSYIQTTPAPFGPTFDFAISDPATATQTFQVIFTGQAAGQNLGTTPWFIPLDARSGANPAVFDNNLPGSGIAYYVPCENPATVPTTFTFNPAGAASQGYYNNAYPAPGTPYGPMTCAFPVNHLYDAGGNPSAGPGLPMLFSGYPGLTTAQANGTLSTPGWLIVSQDINPGVVRMQLDRRAAAGLLEGTYVAQFLVTTYDSQAGMASHPGQWPPCGPQSTLNPYNPPTGAAAIPCAVASTPLPADNASVLVTVRLVVRPALFLSRNAGILTGITSPLAIDPLYGPTATLSTEDGTGQVPNWLFTGTINDTVVFPPLTTLYEGLGGVPGLLNVNAGPIVCVPGSSSTVAGTTTTSPWPTLNPATGLAWVAGSFPATVTIPCPVTATTPAPYTGALSAATAYSGNGPGDGSGNGGIPNISYLYDLGTVQSPNIGIEQDLSPSRPDLPTYVGAFTGPGGGGIFNAGFQGGTDPVTQRNDATIHKYYTTAEGAATLSVAAINCTNWSTQNGQTHVNAVGNWLAVNINGGSPGTTASYTPICTDLSTTTIGTQKAPATFCKTGCTFTSAAGIPDDVSTEASSYPLTGTINGTKISLDFLAKAFTDRTAMNGIPTGTYTAQVFVWSTRAKNVVPGYCLGSSMPISPGGVDPTPNPCTPSTSAIGSSANPNPFVPVQNVQTFTVSLFVFDTTQVIQITPNSCQSTTAPSVTVIGDVLNSENINTGNVTPPFGNGSATPVCSGCPIPNYSNFGPNGDDLVQFSLLPFQTTGTNITGCFFPNQICNQTVNGAGTNQPVALPIGVTVNAQTLAQYNSCALPTGTFNGQSIVNGLAVNGANVPGIGTLVSTGNITLVGPSSQATFLPGGTGTNNQWTLYVCRPTTAPAWLNSSLYPGNSLTPSGSPEPYANGNGPFGGPNSVPQLVTGCSATGDPASSAACKAGMGPVPTINGLTCPLGIGNGGGGGSPSFSSTALGVYRPGSVGGSGDGELLDTSRVNNTLGTFTFYPNFFTGNFNGAVAAAGDLAVAGDWSGNGHASVGVYRPSTGQWFLDLNRNGIYDSGDLTYSFGGLSGDLPVVGDWAQTGKSCIGIFRQGFLWVLDAGCTGNSASSSTVTFPFGGISGDVPVVGAWTGAGTRVGVVRKYAPGGVPQGVPFFWVLDGAAATAGPLPANHPVATGGTLTPFAFGGLACTSLFPGCPSVNPNLSPDMFVTGDWLATGVWHAGVYRAGTWLEDTTGAHTYDTDWAFGGIPGDQPIPGKW